MDNTLDPVDSVDPVEHDKDVPGQKAQVTARTAREEVEATRTGLEPATSGSTVRGSNQLSYRAVGSTWMANYIGRPASRKTARHGDFRLSRGHLAARVVCIGCDLLPSIGLARMPATVPRG